MSRRRGVNTPQRCDDKKSARSGSQGLHGRKEAPFVGSRHQLRAHPQRIPYLSVVIDTFSRRVVRSETATTTLCARASFPAWNASCSIEEGLRPGQRPQSPWSNTSRASTIPADDTHPQVPFTCKLRREARENRLNHNSPSVHKNGERSP